MAYGRPVAAGAAVDPHAGRRWPPRCLPPPIMTGAADASLGNVLRWLFGVEGAEQALSARDRIIILDIRLPRAVMGLLVGASLAVSGAIMQGLFRNPLADPGARRRLLRREPRRGSDDRARQLRFWPAVCGFRILCAAGCRIFRRPCHDAPALPDRDTRAARPRSQPCCLPASRSVRSPTPSPAF